MELGAAKAAWDAASVTDTFTGFRSTWNPDRLLRPPRHPLRWRRPTLSRTCQTQRRWVARRQRRRTLWCRWCLRWCRHPWSERCLHLLMQDFSTSSDPDLLSVPLHQWLEWWPHPRVKSVPTYLHRRPPWHPLLPWLLTCHSLVPATSLISPEIQHRPCPRGTRRLRNNIINNNRCLCTVVSIWWAWLPCRHLTYPCPTPLFWQVCRHLQWHLPWWCPWTRQTRSPILINLAFQVNKSSTPNYEVKLLFLFLSRWNYL